MALQFMKAVGFQSNQPIFFNPKINKVDNISEMYETTEMKDCS